MATKEISYPGLLISIEGIDGSGKSSLMDFLVKELAARDINLLRTKESGGTEFGKQLHRIVQYRTEALDAKAEFCVFAADRAQHFTQVVIPGLEQGLLVISDRMADSSIAYQGYGRQLDVSMIRQVNRWVMQGVTPDLTLLIDLDTSMAIARLQDRPGNKTVFDREKIEFFESVRLGFLTELKNREHYVIDGSQSRDAVAKDALQAVVKFIKKTGWSHVA
ncbi:dTMP kinase [bacterium]|jgi:dTMP kinase|nr:dTMP kinase [bacterium]MBT3903570.1 dTMP kinase [bacterium]MBT5345713.1 dTMP kinase [bacterium]MBT6130795.1 dTMP kinase [bacterium]MBT6528733.1 dTMP kinase [bacterium]